MYPFKITFQIDICKLRLQGVAKFVLQICLWEINLR